MRFFINETIKMSFSLHFFFETFTLNTILQQLQPSMRAIPGNVSNRPGFYWGRDAQFYWGRSCKLLQNEDGRLICTYKNTQLIKMCTLYFNLNLTWWLHLLQISHIIREIRQFQQTPYRIEHQAKVSSHLAFFFLSARKYYISNSLFVYLLKMLKLAAMWNL